MLVFALSLIGEARQLLNQNLLPPTMLLRLMPLFDLASANAPGEFSDEESQLVDFNEVIKGHGPIDPKTALHFAPYNTEKPTEPCLRYNSHQCTVAHFG